ncbi:MAG: FecR family protein [Bacteroidales bacterium]
MKQIISNYLNHRASEAELLQLQKWMEESPENRALLHQLKNNFALASYSDEIPERKPDLFFGQTERNDSSSEMVEMRPNPRASRFGQKLKYAAIAILAIGLGKLVENGVSEWSHPAMHHLSVNEGEKASVMLADGTTVWLNSNSSISYPGKFSWRKREITLRGEAFFQVSKSKHHPFIVKTEQVDVKVLGTSFNVRAYESDSLVEVQVTEGKVMAYPSHDVKGAYLLTANQMATFDLRSKQSSSDPYDSETGNWRNGRYLFKDKKLKDIVTQLERLYAVNIRIEEAYLGEEIYYGEINTRDSIEKILDIISLGRNFRYERNEKQISIKPY